VVGRAEAPLVDAPTVLNRHGGSNACAYTGWLLTAGVLRVVGWLRHLCGCGLDCGGCGARRWRGCASPQDHVISGQVVSQKRKWLWEGDGYLGHFALRDLRTRNGVIGFSFFGKPIQSEIRRPMTYARFGSAFVPGRAGAVLARNDPATLQTRQSGRCAVFRVSGGLLTRNPLDENRPSAGF